MVIGVVRVAVEIMMQLGPRGHSERQSELEQQQHGQEAAQPTVFPERFHTRNLPAFAI